MPIEWYINNGLLIAEMVIFTCLNLNARINKYLTFAIIFVPTVTFAFSVGIFDSISQSIFGIGPMVWFAAISMILFKDKIKTKVFIVLIMASLQLLSAIIAEGLINAFCSSEYSDESLDIVFFVAVVLLFVSVAFTHFRNKHNYDKQVSKNFWVFIIFPISHFLVLYSSSMLLRVETVFEKGKPLAVFGTDSDIVYVFLSFGAVVCCIADVAMFFIMKRSAQNEKLREELRFRDYQDKLSLDYYHSLEQSAANARKTKHDLNNILQISYGLFSAGGEVNTEKSERLIQQLKASIDSLQVERYSDNLLINVIVSNKIKACNDAEIHFLPDINVPQDIGIEDIDLCRAYVNLLDNAINAAKQLDESQREIKVESYIDSGVLYIKTVNPNPPESEKEKPGDHGNGLNILQDIAQKYGGSLITDRNSDTFTALLALKI